MSWKPIKGWENLYEVNEMGEVRRIDTQRLVKGDKNNLGYCRVTLYDKGKKERLFRHRIVAQTFLPNPNNETEVNHIDENKSNNHVSNLEWCNRKYNERANHYSLGKPLHKFKVIYNNGVVKSYDFMVDCASDLNVSKTLISFWLKGISNTYTKYGIKEIKDI